MEKFILKSTQGHIDENEMNIMLHPDHLYLNDKICVSVVVDLRNDVNSQITDAITQYKPILFQQIQEMDNIPQYVKDNIEL